MSENGYYPLWSYTDPNAPYNQPYNSDKDFRVTISQTLSKNVIVWTNDYELVEDIDEDGFNYVPDTEGTCWKEAYENNHLTILQLLTELKRYIKKDLYENPQNRGRLEYLLNECEGWIEDDYEVVE